MEEITKKKSFENPKKIIIAIIVIIVIGALALGGIYFFYNQTTSSTTSSIPKANINKIDETSLKKLNEHQFYGQPLDSQNLGRPDPFQPY